MCRQLALGRYENFSVLSWFVPRQLRDSFAAVYAFCRWADDLGDEIPDPQKALDLLVWWRAELEDCYRGQPRHPVFIALHPVIERHDLPQQLFDDLICAFEQDQRIFRYENWDQLIGYCRLSANPVGRLVLMLLDEPREDALFHRSDEICTALQLTNHWQDIHRDIMKRDRIYIPAECHKIEGFEERLIGSARQGYAVDREFLGESCQLVRNLVERTWPIYERGSKLLEKISTTSRPIIWLFSAGGQHVLRSIELWNYETVLHRPKLSIPAKLGLLFQAGLMTKLKRFNR